MPGYRSIWTYLNTVPHKLAFLDAGGVRTRYLEAGNPDGPVVLLLHGTAGSLENYCANYGPLARTHSVIGIDMLGCGYTDKPDRPYLIPDYAAHVLACSTPWESGGRGHRRFPGVLGRGKARPGPPGPGHQPGHGRPGRGRSSTRNRRRRIRRRPPAAAAQRCPGTILGIGHHGDGQADARPGGPHRRPHRCPPPDIRTARNGDRDGAICSPSPPAARTFP